MHLLIYTLCLLSTWAMVSYLTWDQLQVNYWWSSTYQNSLDSSMRLKAQIEYQHWAAFKRPRKSSRVTVKPRRILDNYWQERTQDDDQLMAEDPVRRLHKHFKPENQRLPVEMKVYHSAPQVWYGVWSRLIHDLYRQCPLYAQMAEDHPDIAHELLDALFIAIAQLDQRLPAKGCRSSYDLAQLDLGSARLNRLWYTLVKGSDATGGDYPSILRYVWFKDWVYAAEKCSVNIHFCEFPVASALLGRGLAEYMFQERERLIEETITQRGLKGDRSQFILTKAALDALFIRYIREHGGSLEALNELISDTSGASRKPSETVVFEYDEKERIQSWTLINP